MSLTLQGKRGLVIGGSRGIGAGIVKRLAADGATIAFTFAASKDRAEQVVDEVAQAGGNAIAIQADSSVATDVIGGVQRGAAELGGLDILVNNAGGGKLAQLTDYTLDEIEYALDFNVRGPVLAIREAIGHLSDGGRIINIGSINAERIPFPGATLYGLGKGAAATLTRGLARELAPRMITVNNIQPGPIETELNRSDGPQGPLMFSTLALQRYGTVEEVAAFVAFLAGPEAGFITGASLNIDGGFGA